MTIAVEMEDTERVQYEEARQTYLDFLKQAKIIWAPRADGIHFSGSITKRSGTCRFQSVSYSEAAQFCLHHKTGMGVETDPAAPR